MTEQAKQDKLTRPNPLRDLTDASLNFLATASNETLGACAVGLCASTYLVLGRVGLVLIGAVGGIVLHATWESQNGIEGQSSADQANRRKRELGVEVVKRVLDWRTCTQREKDDSVEKIEPTATTQTLDYLSLPLAPRAALEDFTDAVIENYVDWWYAPMLPNEESFPIACRQTLTAFILSFSNHLSHKRTADPFLDFLANSTSIIIVFLNELSTALRASQRATPEDAIRTYLKYEPESNLANVLSKTQQEKKLDLVADDILQSFLDSKAYNFPPARTFLRQVLSQLVLGTTVTMCSQPEHINSWIVYLLEEGEPELLNVIDSGVEDMETALENTKEVSAATGTSTVDRGHKRRISKAEEAMQEALLEAKRMNEMIAEEEARGKRESTTTEQVDDTESSAATTEAGIATPATSDDSDSSPIVLDSDGTPHIFSSPQKPPRPESLRQTIPNDLNTPDYENAFTFPTGPPISELATLHPISSQTSDVNLVLTLHNASITIYDDSGPNDKSTFKQRPSADYLLQIEPASSRFPGWMISRKYVDFEGLHESLRRIAVISGASQFAQKHPILPTWKSRPRSALTQDLESYLRDALRYETLAESEAMKKFLDKEIGLDKAPVKNKNVLDHGTAALENVGKGFINVIGQGGKGIAGGGKAVLGGVQGVFGAVATGVGGQKKTSTASTRGVSNALRSASPLVDEYSPRPSQESVRPQPSPQDASTAPPLPKRASQHLYGHEIGRPTLLPDQELVGEILNLPPPPSEITGDYSPVKADLTETAPRLPPRTTTSSRPTTPTPSIKSPEIPPPPITTQPTATPELSPPNPSKSSSKTSSDSPITEEETRITIELLFAIITELYSLSTSWTTIRLSLLSAAKTFLLRPANPQLESIRTLLQDSVIVSYFSPDAIATHIRTLRANTMPTEAERAKWPPEPTDEEKEKLRVKARRLLVQRGMPQALTSVMGAAASGEALGKLFDCLQVPEVGRGLVFALMLQALRAATQ